MPDLLEEKLRSQLEEEKRRWPLFFLHTPGPQPQRALGTTRSFLVIAGWSGPYPGLQLLWEVGLKIVGGGAACEQEDVKGRKLRQGEGGMGSRRPSRPLEPGSVTQAESWLQPPQPGAHTAAQGAAGIVCCYHLGELRGITTEGISQRLRPTSLLGLLICKAPENIRASRSHLGPNYDCTCRGGASSINIHVIITDTASFI